MYSEDRPSLMHFVYYSILAEVQKALKTYGITVDQCKHLLPVMREPSASHASPPPSDEAVAASLQAQFDDEDMDARLNVSDDAAIASGLASLGGIGGDTPMQDDSIFDISSTKKITVTFPESQAPDSLPSTFGSTISSDLEPETPAFDDMLVYPKPDKEES